MNFRPLQLLGSIHTVVTPFFFCTELTVPVRTSTVPLLSVEVTRMDHFFCTCCSVTSVSSCRRVRDGVSAVDIETELVVLVVAELLVLVFVDSVVVSDAEKTSTGVEGVTRSIGDSLLCLVPAVGEGDASVGGGFRGECEPCFCCGCDLFRCWDAR